MEKAVGFTMLRRVKCQDVLLYDRESSGLTDDSYNYIIYVHCLYNYTSHHYYCASLQHITILKKIY